MRRPTAIGALICVSCLLGGCDSESGDGSRHSEGQARAVAQKFVSAITSEDAITACRQFLPRSGEIFFNGPCDPRPSIPQQFEELFANGGVRGVRVKGDRAEVATQSRAGGGGGLILKRTESGWKIFNTSEGSTAARQDQVAVRQVLAASLAYGSYAAAHGNSFDGANPRDLRKYSKSVPLHAKLTSTEDTFAIEVRSQSGNVFRQREESRRNGIETVDQTCRDPGVGKCPSDGSW